MILKVIIIAMISILIVFSAVSFIVTKKIFNDMFARVEFDGYNVNLRYDDIKEKYGRELMSFTSGKNQLQGYLYGEDNTKGLVVISHGHGGMADNYLPETVYFVDNGYQVFTFDNTGCNRSEGANSVGVTQSVIDLDAALTFIERQGRFAGLPILLYGHSWGGYAVTAIHNFDHKIKASVSVAGFNSPMEIVLEWGKKMMGALVYLEYPYIYLYQRMFYGKKINLSAVEGINNTDTPVLLIHGNQDTTILYEGASIFAHKNAITNPRVEFKTCDKELQNDHKNLYKSLRSIQYVKETQKEYRSLLENYQGEIPQEIKKAFYDNVDRFRASVLDEQFMQDVLNFYEKSNRIGINEKRQT